MFYRLFTFLFFVLLATRVPAQNYAAYNIQVLARLTPNTADQGFDGRRYSGCWGWYQANKNKEYAIAGTSNGTYFYDITNAQSPVQKGFIQGTQGATYREIKTKDHYAYIISDDITPNGLQIVDLQYLPDSLPLLYSGDAFFKRAHSAWVDGRHLYLASTTFSNNFSPMTVWSLANPTAPVLMRRLEQDFPFINLVHDMHTRNDTIYASCANQGLFVFYFDTLTGKFLQLGSYSGFAGAGYNHSSALTADGKSLVFCEEIPAALPIHLLNVSNPSNVTSLCQLLPYPKTTPHNPFVKGQFAFISCYEDGLFIYDISDPANPSRAGYFDTYYQGGANTGVYGPINYRGNWGNYPFLPSGHLIANDMQNGLFILDASAAYTTTVKDYLGFANLEQKVQISVEVRQKKITLLNPSHENVHFKLKDVCGKVLQTKDFNCSTEIDLSEFSIGVYICQLSTQQLQIQKKIIIQD